MSLLADNEILNAHPKWKPYPTYRDSGIDWLGTVPEHWAIDRVREHAELINGYPFESELFSLSDGMPLVRIRDLESETTEVFYSGPVVSEALIKTGDIIIGMDGDFNVARWRGGQALLNQRLCCLRPKPTIEKTFLFYFISFPVKVINDLTYSTTVKHLSSLNVIKSRFTRPPLNEQIAIVAFLDRETAKIDALVTKKERLIELLQEKRAAIISHAVTQGLDPSVPMKDSGIEWLGKIPAHWEVAPLYARYEVALGKMLDTKRISGEYLAPYLRNVDVQWDSVNVDGLPEMDFALADRSRYALHVGDLLVCEGGEVGRTAMWAGELQECYYQKAVHRLRRIRNTDVSRFFYYVMYASAKSGRFVAGGNPNTIDHLTAIQLKQYRFAFPPNEEQRAIAVFLDSETGKINALIAKVREGIEKLTEYRTALVSAAVTGKIDVSEEAATASQHLS